MSCLFWPCSPAAIWLTWEPSCFGDGAEPNGSQALASFRAWGGMGGAPGRGVLWGPSPFQGSPLQVGVQELSLHGAHSHVCTYRCLFPTYMDAYAPVLAPGPAAEDIV